MCKDLVIEKMVYERLKQDRKTSCDLCHETKVTHVCLDCRHYLCNTCSSVHSISKLSYAHKQQTLPTTWTSVKIQSQSDSSGLEALCRNIQCCQAAEVTTVDTQTTRSEVEMILYDQICQLKNSKKDVDKLITSLQNVKVRLTIKQQILGMYAAELAKHDHSRVQTKPFLNRIRQIKKDSIPPFPHFAALEGCIRALGHCGYMTSERPNTPKVVGAEAREVVFVEQMLELNRKKTESGNQVTAEQSPLKFKGVDRNKIARRSTAINIPSGTVHVETVTDPKVLQAPENIVVAKIDWCNDRIQKLESERSEMKSFEEKNKSKMTRLDENIIRVTRQVKDVRRWWIQRIEEEKSTTGQVEKKEVKLRKLEDEKNRTIKNLEEERSRLEEERVRLTSQLDEEKTKREVNLKVMNAKQKEEMNKVRSEMNAFEKINKAKVMQVQKDIIRVTRQLEDERRRWTQRIEEERSRTTEQVEKKEVRLRKLEDEKNRAIKKLEEERSRLEEERVRLTSQLDEEKTKREVNLKVMNAKQKEEMNKVRSEMNAFEKINKAKVMQVQKDIIRVTRQLEDERRRWTQRIEEERSRTTEQVEKKEVRLRKLEDEKNRAIKKLEEERSRLEEERVRLTSQLDEEKTKREVNLKVINAKQKEEIQKVRSEMKAFEEKNKTKIMRFEKDIDRVTRQLEDERRWWTQLIEKERSKAAEQVEKKEVKLRQLEDEQNGQIKRLEEERSRLEEEKVRLTSQLDEERTKREVMKAKHKEEMNKEKKNVIQFVMRLEGRDRLLSNVLGRVEDGHLSQVVRQLLHDFHIRLLGVDCGLNFLMEVPASRWGEVVPEKLQRVLSDLVPETDRQKATWSNVIKLDRSQDVDLRFGQSLPTPKTVRNLSVSTGRRNHGNLSIPPVSNSDVRDDRALQRVLHGMRSLADNGQQKEVMFVVSQLQFDNYLGESSFAPTAALLPRPRTLPERFRQQHYDKGDFDVLIIHRQHGLFILEINSVGEDFSLGKMTKEQEDDLVKEKVEVLTKQLNKAMVVLRHLTLDLKSKINIIKCFVMPNIKSSQLKRAINRYPSAGKILCQCLGVQSVLDAVKLCLLSDQLSDKQKSSESFVQGLRLWWQNVIRASGTDPLMKSSLYEQLLARFCGPATTVEVHSVIAPRLNIRTLGKAVSETGERGARLMLFQQQLDILNRSSPRAFLSGPPGTGKTIVLIMQGLTWLQRGHDVHVVSTWDGSRAATIVIEHQLQETVKTLTAKPRVHRHQFDFEKDGEVKTAVRRLKSLSEGRQLCVIADEVVWDYYRESFTEFCDQLIVQVPGVFIWGASMYYNVRPLCLQEVKLITPLRSPPVILREVMDSWLIKNKQVHDYMVSDIPVATDGPPVMRIKHCDGQSGHTGHLPLDCVECGHQVARVLTELDVGRTGDSNVPPPLQYCDVLVLCFRYPTDSQLDSNGQVSTMASGLVRGLRDCHVPVRVVKFGDEAAIRDTALGVGDLVTVANWCDVQGLERKVVVVETEIGGYNRLLAMSRCTSQLVVIDSC